MTFSISRKLIFAFIVVTVSATVACPRPIDPPSKTPSKITSPTTSLQSEKTLTPARNTESVKIERHIQSRIDDVVRAREAMQAVIKQVPKEKKRALDLEKRLGHIKKSLDNAVVQQEMKLAAQELDAAQKRAPKGRQATDPGEKRAVALMEQAADVDKLLRSALSPIAGSSDGGPLDPHHQRLLRKLSEQQRALMTLATATKLAFRSLTVVEQMGRAVPRLELRLGQRHR